MSTFDRDPAKRKVRPCDPAEALLDLDIGESSDDSDFRIEDHAEESDDCSINSDNDNKEESESGSQEDSDEEKIKNSTKSCEDLSVVDILERARKSENFQFPGNFAEMLICAGCLGSRSDDSNEIVECDGCGVTVHEGCYGVSDVTSESSTISSASTEPWFCEACKAGVENPTCELCPNLGGIFKETEVGAWVHLVCALYVPGVAFSEVEKLSGVTLFELAYSRWGARSCSLCSDATLARTGVCVGCDAGLCKTFFHVTCGQREGLLAEAHSDEVEQADPFYAHCKMHSDKTLIKKRKRNWLALQLRTEKRRMELQHNTDTMAKIRTQRKLIKYRKKYTAHKLLRNPPWVPTQKMARMIFSSASAMRRFARKAERMGVDTHALEFQDTQMAALKDVSRRWHVPPAFSVEFVGYYLERNSRVLQLRDSLRTLAQENTLLVNEEQNLRTDYEEASKQNKEAIDKMNSVRNSLLKLYKAITSLCPNKSAPTLLDDAPLLPPEPFRTTPRVTPAQLQSRSMSVPTAAALKMGVGFPLSNRSDARQASVLSTSYGANASVVGLTRQCAVCSLSSEQHLLAGCDTCHKYYHLHCLSPPLQRMPKKSKLYGWQCSECDKSSDSEPEVMEKKVPRRSRTRYSKDGTIISASEPLSPLSAPVSPVPLRPKTDTHNTEKTVDTTTGPDTKPMKIISNVKLPENPAPLKMTIKPIEFNADDKKEKKIKKKKNTETIAENNTDVKKSRKRSFTSPALTNTPLMSITPLVADSPQDSLNENSNSSTINPNTNLDTNNTFLSPNSSFSSLLEQNKTEQENKAMECSIETSIANLSSDIASYKANRKRRKEKHRSRYSPDLLRAPSKPHKHKRKKKSQDVEVPHLPRITIKIKTIPKPGGSVETQLFYVPTESNDGPPPDVLNQLEAGESVALVVGPTEPEDTNLIPSTSERTRVARSSAAPRGSGCAPASSLPPLTQCDVCKQQGDGNNLVRCDECTRRYHFTCLEPPLNRNPKKRGYSWHCAECDPTDAESN